MGTVGLFELAVGEGEPGLPRMAPLAAAPSEPVVVDGAARPGEVVPVPGSDAFPGATIPLSTVGVCVLVKGCDEAGRDAAELVEGASKLDSTTRWVRAAPGP